MAGHGCPMTWGGWTAIMELENYFLKQNAYNAKTDTFYLWNLTTLNGATRNTEKPWNKNRFSLKLFSFTYANN